MGLVAAELERQGISTVALQLLHKIPPETRPPRGLWVPFWHGYPLGPPDQPDRQRAVIEAAFRLLEDDAVSPPALLGYADEPAPSDE